MANFSNKNLIFQIYAHAMLGVAVVIVAIGTYSLLRNLTGRYLLSQYPLGYEENRCDYLASPVMPATLPAQGEGIEIDLEAERERLEAENRRAKEECKTQLEEYRTRTAEREFAIAINVLIVGILLLIPHAFMVASINRKN